MNSLSPETQTPETQAQITPFQQSFLSFMRSHVVGTVGTSVVLSVLVLGASTYNIWKTYQGFRSSVVQQVKLRALSDEVVHLDEVLTMSARMAASTGDAQWEKRYWDNEPNLTQAITEVTALASANVQKNSKQTDAANQQLITLEEQAFKLIADGKKVQAFQLLLSPEYLKHKDVYSAGIEATLNDVNQRIDRELKAYEGRLGQAVIFTSISCVVLITGWSFILFVVRSDIRRREQAEKNLRASQESLQTSNAALEETQKNLAQKAEHTHLENEIMEAEVGYLLDVVSTLESGDLTLEAEVSDRLTGLVADMLNQLTEELTRVISTVNETAIQVSNGAFDVEKLSDAASQRVQQQVEAIEQVQALMAKVDHLSKKLLGHARVTQDSLFNAQREVVKGETEMTSMKDGIISLQQGTNQINRRVSSLNAYMEMAAQFAQSQKRVASLTRVLAFNASMVASRAAEQQDPDQFASVAREFGAIATQVNDLAGQTNQSLETLMQRTQQIQSAVSGINNDTQEINVLVEDFIQSVQQSSHSFESIKSVTENIVQWGQQVATASEQITDAAGYTLQSIESIQADGLETEAQSQLTREQASQMGQLANELLARMQFFKVKTIPISSETLASETLASETLASTAQSPTKSDPRPLYSTPEKVLAAQVS